MHWRGFPRTFLAKRAKTCKTNHGQHERAERRPGSLERCLRCKTSHAKHIQLGRGADERTNAGRASQGKIRCHVSRPSVRPLPSRFLMEIFEAAGEGNLPRSSSYVLLPLLLLAISLNAYSRVSSVSQSATDRSRDLRGLRHRRPLLLHCMHLRTTANACIMTPSANSFRRTLSHHSMLPQSCSASLPPVSCPPPRREGEGKRAKSADIFTAGWSGLVGTRQFAPPSLPLSAPFVCPPLSSFGLLVCRSSSTDHQCIVHSPRRRRPRGTRGARTSFGGSM